MINKPKGTYDIYGSKGIEFQIIKDIIKNIVDNYNYEYISTPIFESSELFHRSVGETSDIVSKETYDFKDRGDRNLTLRPEGTAGVVRCIIENKLYSSKPKKFWYLGSMYRYERPQAGRFREFYQFGCEVFGKSAMLDAEIIGIAYEVLASLGITSVVKINSLGGFETREKYKEELVKFLKPNIDNFCSDCKERLEKNPLRILDCKVDKDNEIFKKIPKLSTYLSKTEKEYFEEVLKYLEAMEISYEKDDTLVRGLDYYTDTVFEIVSNNNDTSSSSVLAAGGRYDKLVETLGGNDTPAVGMAMGLERIMEVVKNSENYIENKNSVDCYIAPITKDENDIVFAFANTLRLFNIKTEIDYLNSGLKSSFKDAERLDAKFMIIIGADEKSSGIITIKNLTTKEEKKVQLFDAIKYLQKELMDLEEDEKDHFMKYMDDMYQGSCTCDNCDCDEGCNCSNCDCDDKCDCNSNQYECQNSKDDE